MVKIAVSNANVSVRWAVTTRIHSFHKLKEGLRRNGVLVQVVHFNMTRMKEYCVVVEIKEHEMYLRAIY